MSAQGEVRSTSPGRPLRATRVTAGAVYFVLHLFLDWLSQRYPDSASGIIALNPAAGLGIVLVCLYGRRLTGLILVTALMSSVLLRNSTETLIVACIEGLIVGVIYSGAALFLSSPLTAFNARLETLRDLLSLIAVAVPSSALVAVCYVGLLASFGGVGAEGVLASTLRYWLGDLIGISIMAPFGLLLLQSRVDFHPTPRSVLQLVITAALLVAAILTRDSGRFPYFYFLFFPAIWIAVASGLEGVVVALALIQAGMVCAVIGLQMSFLDITDFQARMVALAATALTAGALVSDRRKAEEDMHRHHDALAKIATRGSLGELGTAIAHEVNQPLSAAGTFASLVADGLEDEQLRDASLRVNARKTVRQIDRASNVVRGLRALVRLADHEQAPVSAERILTEVADLASLEAMRLNIEIRVSTRAGLPMIQVDRLQIEQALLNLTQNSMEAIESADSAERTITLYAREVEGGAIEIGVIDSGPGFPPGFTLERLKPFESSKETGLGVGLSLCRSIGLANGARLSLHELGRGAQASLTFDLDRRVDHV